MMIMMHAPPPQPVKMHLSSAAPPAPLRFRPHPPQPRWRGVHAKGSLKTILAMMALVTTLSAVMVVSKACVP